MKLEECGCRMTDTYKHSESLTIVPSSMLISTTSFAILLEPFRTSMLPCIFIVPPVHV